MFFNSYKLLRRANRAKRAGARAPFINPQASGSNVSTEETGDTGDGGRSLAVAAGPARGEASYALYGNEGGAFFGGPVGGGAFLTGNSDAFRSGPGTGSAFRSGGKRAGGSGGGGPGQEAEEAFGTGGAFMGTPRCVAAKTAAATDAAV